MSRERATKTDGALPLEVVEIPGERLCYNVASRSNPGAFHRVDLLAHGGLSECSCRDWITRRWRVVKTGSKATCIHVRAARERFLDDLLAKLSQQEYE
jgi:hypothetical protein